MEELSEEQRQAILNQRQAFLAKMGVPNVGRMMTESSVVNSSNGSMAAKLAAIKNGSARAELSKYIHADGKNAPGSHEFQGLPEPKMKKNPNAKKETVDPRYKQELASFNTPSQGGNSEFAAIEMMMGGGDSPARMTSHNPNPQQLYQQNPMEMDLSLDPSTGEMAGMKYMPQFNPHAVLQQKKAMMQQNHASQMNMQQEEFVLANNAAMSNSGLNMQTMQFMMETIAKGIAEKTIRSVLNEYTQQEKNKNYFEFYKGRKDIIKTSDGKLFRLTQVEVKNK